uniref:Uncharacterized protein n=1 Tax=Hyaloperonospora arabidopsidis (strain Emoy2) TaxID=559515 RepID=M4B3A3_HYAAE
MPRVCCARSHQLREQTAQGRCFTSANGDILRTASWNWRLQEVMTTHTRHSIWSKC